MIYHVCQFSVKMNNFSVQICPKIDWELDTEKSNVRIRISQHRRDTLCANFQPKWTTLTFSAQIFPQMDLGLEVQKTNVGIRINILQIPCVSIFRQNGQLWPFRPKFTQENGFWGQNFKNLSPDSESAPPRYRMSQFSVKMNYLEFFGLNLGKLPNYVWYFGSNKVERTG